MSQTDPTPAEQHLGDRLAALVDGELKHDARDRVLAHLATCARCAAEAAAQRRLKSVFATAAPPSPSEGFLARLQGLPGGPPGGDDDRQGRPVGGSGRFGDGLFPGTRPPGGRADLTLGPGPLDGFGYLPTVHGGATALPASPARSGFRIHEVGREADRSPWRGRRFAFAAASAVSLAAIALGGALPTSAGSDGPNRASGSGNSVTPVGSDARTGGGATAGRRNGSGQGSRATSGQGNGNGPVGNGTVSLAVNTASAGFAPAASLLGTGRLTGTPYGLSLRSDVSAPIRPGGAGPLLARSLGSGLHPVSAAAPEPSLPPTSAAAKPASADHGLPLAPRR
ncbi:zf-HC2 domain containing protein [Streptomyces sp. col6]|uniref:zf-HC2 domain-containing protein n=1 Tax=Streptomyces sp. col6 TaxID=2478958 RepID=UPI0011CEA207|nr:zf-HC2 domain-containing protein [Streptomyces sp. col6]TXS06060.1 zf-HC2 domain containing protein [Streptomyces sp. col6]